MNRTFTWGSETDAPGTITLRGEAVERLADAMGVFPEDVDKETVRAYMDELADAEEAQYQDFAVRTGIAPTEIPEGDDEPGAFELSEDEEATYEEWRAIAVEADDGGLDPLDLP